MFAVESWGRGCERVSGQPSSVLLMTTHTITLREGVRRVGASPGRPGREELRRGFRLSDGQDRIGQGQAREGHPPTGQGHASKSEPQDPGGKRRGKRERKDEQDRGPGRSRGKQSAEREEREARLDLVRRNDMTDRVVSKGKGDRQRTQNEQGGIPRRPAEANQSASVRVALGGREFGFRYHCHASCGPALRSSEQWKGAMNESHGWDAAM